MILLRCPQNIYLAVQEAIQLTSKFQVQCETSFTYHEEEVIEIKMTGEPWAAVEDEFAPLDLVYVYVWEKAFSCICCSCDKIMIEVHIYFYFIRHSV